nr:reverse transcriptase domain-containing protein [Tanacetum cinerariifolium]
MANTTPLVTTVTKPANNPGEANTTPRVNIHEFCEEYYEDILQIIMEKVRHDRRKDVHTRLDFGEGPRERIRKIPTIQIQGPETQNQNSDTYPPSATKSHTQKADSRNPPRGRSRARTLSVLTDNHHKDRERFRITRESYGDSFSHSYRDKSRHHHMKRRRDQSPPSSAVWFDELPPESIDGYKDLKEAFLAYFMQQKNMTNPKSTSKKGLTFEVTQGKEGGLTDLPPTRTPKEILAAKASKFQPPPLMVTLVEKRSSNKFCDFHNDKGHNTDEWMQLKKQIEELVRAGKLSHLIKEIKQGREQPKIGRKKAATKDKPTTIYMVRSWQRTVRQKVTQSFKQVKEIVFPPLTPSNETEGPLVIKAEMGGHIIHRMYIDGGSSMEILYEHCFNRLRPEIKSQMVPTTTSLTGFSGETIWLLGQLRLLVIIGDATHSTKAWMNFMVVKSLSPYKGIIGQPGLKAIQAVPFTVHGMLKFLVEGGVVTICNTLLIPFECALINTSFVVPRQEKTRPSNFLVALHPNFPNQEVVVGGSLSDKGHTELCSVLKKNLYIFSWQPSDMTGAPERAKAIQVEVQKLVEAGIMREVYYHDWLSNPVMVKKHDGSWRIAFEGQVGRNIKVYVDDLGVKIHTEAEMVRDIEETFRTLRKVNMKLNSKKCSFGLAEGVFLGYVITPEGIKPCPDKTAAVRQLPSPRTIKEVQSLNGKLASLNRFLSKSAEKSLPLFQTLKKCIKKSDFHWTAEAEQAFQQLKQHLSELPLLVAPRPQEELIMINSSNFLIEIPSDVSQAVPAAMTQEEPWTHFTDGSSCVDGSGAGIILTNPEGVEFTYALRFQFMTSNNEAEYEALVAGLRIATQMGVKNIQVNGDSKLTPLAKSRQLALYTLSKQVLVEVLENKSIKGKEVTAVIEEEGPTWMTQLVDYLKEGILPGDEKDARKIRLKSRQYEFMEGVLYRRSFLTPCLRCVGPLQADYVMREIHKGSCSMHAGPRSVVAQAMRLGYYWPTMHKDARDMIQKCSNWSRHSRPLYKRDEESQIPDSRHGLFHKVDRSKGSGKNYRRTDNGKQFADNPFKDWCNKLNITQRFASVRHPQSNGLVERANRSLGEGIKARLGEGNKNWVEELPHVLWAHRTMIKLNHGDTPFSLTYKTEAVIPTEIGMPTYRTASVDVQKGKTLMNHGRHGHQDAIRPGVMRRANPVSTAHYAAFLLLLSTTNVCRNSVRQYHLFFASPRVLGVTFLWVNRDGELRGAGTEVAYILWGVIPSVTL